MISGSERSDKDVIMVEGGPLSLSIWEVVFSSDSMHLSCRVRLMDISASQICVTFSSKLTLIPTSSPYESLKLRPLPSYYMDLEIL